MLFGRRLLRQPVRGDGGSNHIRIVLLLYATGDWAAPFRTLFSKRGRYNKTCNQDTSCHIIREPHEDNLRRRDCCGQPVEVRLSFTMTTPTLHTLVRLSLAVSKSIAAKFLIHSVAFLIDSVGLGMQMYELELIFTMFLRKTNQCIQDIIYSI